MEMDTMYDAIEAPVDAPPTSAGRLVLSVLTWASVGITSFPITYMISTEFTREEQGLQALGVAFGLGLAGLVAGLVFGAFMAPRRLLTHAAMILAVILLAAIVLLLAMWLGAGPSG